VQKSLSMLDIFERVMLPENISKEYIFYFTNEDINLTILVGEINIFNKWYFNS